MAKFTQRDHPQDRATRLNGMLDRLAALEAAPPTYANNAAALAGGLAVGDIYQTAAGELRITV